MERISNKEYRSREGVSKSDLQELFKTPLHFKYRIEHASEDTPALTFGRAAHKYILEKEDFYKEFCMIPKIDRRTKEGKLEYDRYMRENAGLEIISEEDLKTVDEMAFAIDCNPLARKLLTGTCETSWFWNDPVTGEPCKCRPDCIATHEGKKYIVDYKTCEDASEFGFIKNVRKYHYKLQAGMYTEGLWQNELEEYGFVFVAQEKKAPYAVQVYFCDEEFIRQGKDEFRQLIGLLHHCKETGNWFGYEGEYDTPSTLLPDIEYIREEQTNE